MTPSERERRIEAVMGVLMVNPEPPTGYRHTAERILDAADEAVPTVSKEWASDQVAYALGRGGGVMSQRPSDRQRAERAEAAARDFGKVLAAVVFTLQGDYERDPDWMCDTRAVLGRWPSFSGEEGSE